MKKVILAMSLASMSLFANDTTIDATMKLMEQGIFQVQKGFIYNSKSDIIRGVETISSANSIFTHVDVSTFIENNSKVQVTKNINANLSKHLDSLKTNTQNSKFSDAGANYAQVLNDCVSCHTIIRGW